MKKGNQRREREEGKVENYGQRKYGENRGIGVGGGGGGRGRGRGKECGEEGERGGERNKEI